jgi:hypothetical protein
VVPGERLDALVAEELRGYFEAFIECHHDLPLDFRDKPRYVESTVRKLVALTNCLGVGLDEFLDVQVKRPEERDEWSGHGSGRELWNIERVITRTRERQQSVDEDRFFFSFDQTN